METEEYEISISETAIKSLKSIQKEDKKKIFKKIENLKENPLEMNNVKKLVDFDISFRLRMGDYRILFERDDENYIIEIIDVRHRKDSYRRK
ncbi:MAG: plasmid stabilization system [Ignavibacteria bacterium]|nr:plasmid stabilization system [Ignavibacteria bacterium]